MISPNIPINDKERVEELEKYKILDTLPEEEYDNLVQLASKICNTPVALFSLIDKDRQWVKSKVGMNVDVVPRELSFCAHAINEPDEIFEVPDMDADVRFRESPFVTGDANIKFYAGIPIKSLKGHGLGTVCVIDNKPRSLSESQREALKALSKQISFIFNHRLERQLVEEQKKQLEVVYENVDHLIFELDIQGNFLYTNQTLVKFLNLPAERLVGNKFINLIQDKEQQKQSEKKFRDQIENKIKSADYQFKTENKESESYDIELNIRLIFDENGEISSIVGVAKDVSDIRKRNSNIKQLSTVVESTTNSVMILDREMKITWVNKSFTRTFGYTAEEALGKNPGDMLNGKLTDTSVLDYIEKRIGEKKPLNAELINYTKSGHAKWIEVVMNPVFNEYGEWTGYVCIEQDITKRKEEQTLINNQHKDIFSSLEYAKRIQRALIPTREQMSEINEESFSLYLPKDVISGDFFMLEKIYLPELDTEVIVYVVADCTGHGIPGAMLSVLCHSILKEAIQNPLVENPGNALDHARKKLFSFLNTSKKQVYDGMDVSLCAIIPYKQTIQFAGANLPLYRIREGKLKVFDGSRQSVGLSRVNKPFNFIEAPYQEGDSYYLFSDGIVDQFGGERNKKFLSRRLKELLLSIQGNSMEEQKLIVKDEFFKWRGDNEQTDDVCLLGFSV